MPQNNVLPGINIQFPISTLIVNGTKAVETRTYKLPDKYINQEIALIETPGKEGKFKARVIAVIKFTECYRYKTKKEFYSQKELHCVDKSSIWAWKDGEKWGWKVKVIKKIKNPKLAPANRGYVFCKNIEI
jgi:hypothetical protein